MMLMVTITGIGPAAAAWSPNEEERCKVVITFLSEELPAIICDNIPRGSQLCSASDHSHLDLLHAVAGACSGSGCQSFSPKRVFPTLVDHN
jgi:hypothetical protein